MKTLVPFVPSWFVFLDVLHQDPGGNGDVEVWLQLMLQPKSIAPLGLIIFFLAPGAHAPSEISVGPPALASRVFGKTSSISLAMDRAKS